MIRFFFTYKNEVVQLPVNPSTLDRKNNSDTKSMQIVELGEITLLKGMKLREFKFKSFLPNYDKYPFILTKGEFQKPQFYIDFFNKIQREKKPCRLIITDTNVNMLVSIQSFDYSYQAGDDDINFDLELKEFKEHTIKILTNQVQARNNSSSVQKTVINSVTSGNSNRPIERNIPRTYTVVRGDNLWNIAKRYLGNGNRYTEIYNLNRNKIRNPRLIYPGQVLTLPST